MGKDIGKSVGFYENFDRKPGADTKVTHYCPGCGHGRIHKLVAEALETLDVVEKTTFISPVGCSVFGYYYFNTGNVQAAHGRAPAVATGVARSNPEGIVISYQGDGDLASIGMAEIIHAANRGENMTVIFVNNSIYGMTGGQMAPTTVQGQVTTTTPDGRDYEEQGFPIKMCEMIATLDAPVYVERVAVTGAKSIMKTKRVIQKAIKTQKDKLGFSFVEILSSCPTGWKETPVKSNEWIDDVLEKAFPLGCYKDVIAERTPKKLINPAPTPQQVKDLLGMEDDTRIFDKDPEFNKNFKDQTLRISGFGGQGVLLAGTTLSYLAMAHDLEVTWLPSYGPEMRGGTANCHVSIANHEIGTPVVENPDILIAMNGPSIDTFENKVSKNGLVIVNSSVTDQKVKREDLTTLYIPMNEIAESVGLRAAANMSALTAYLAYTQAFKLDRLKQLFKVNFKKKHLLDKNYEIMEKTLEYVQKNYL